MSSSTIKAMERNCVSMHVAVHEIVSTVFEIFRLDLVHGQQYIRISHVIEYLWLTFPFRDPFMIMSSARRLKVLGALK